MDNIIWNIVNTISLLCLLLFIWLGFQIPEVGESSFLYIEAGEHKMYLHILNIKD